MRIGSSPRRGTLRLSRTAVPYARAASAAGGGDAPRASAAALARPLTVAESLWCGAVARTVQVLAMYPVDTIKTRVQFSRSASLGALARLRAAVVAGNLYSGTALSLVGQIPYGMMTFGALEFVRDKLRIQFPDAPRWTTTMIAATVGDSVGSLWLTPSEVIKQKTQAGVYAGVGAATSAVAKNAGFAGFYQGYGPCLARDVPFRIFQFGFFEAWNGWYAKRVKRAVLPIENLIIGAMAGTTAAALTTPLDVVRTRMMAQTVGAKGAFKNGLDCVIKTVAMEGPTALFRGIAPRCMLIGPSSAIFFLAYETTKGFFRKRAEKRGRLGAANMAWGGGAAVCGRRSYRA